jgi:hypothetical protein
MGPSFPETEIEALVAQAGLEKKRGVKRNRIIVVCRIRLRDRLEELS